MAHVERSTLRLVVAAVCLAGAAAYAQSGAGSIVQARVVAYASASAFAVLDPAQKLRRVKLTGVDAPERSQRFAPQAQRLASDYLGSGPIAITVDAIDEENNRIHGRVSVDGRDLGLVLLEAGLAWCDPADSARLPPSLQVAYGHACKQAKRERRGLWQDAHPMAPWTYRRIPRFDPPASAEPAKHCRETRRETLDCDDGTRYRTSGSRVIGSDGTIYSRRGNTITGSDGNRFEVQGKSIYGTDGSVCRVRGRALDCY